MGNDMEAMPPPPPRQQPAFEQVVAHLDLDKYSGKWFEIARKPLVWETACAFAEAMYDFDVKDNVMHVANVCLSENGHEMFRRTGVAHRADKNDTSGKLRLNFTDHMPNDGESDYWVLFTDYTSFALVGNADKSKLWILSRTKNMSTCLYNALKRRVQTRNKYDAADLLVHKGVLSKCVHNGLN